MEKPLPLVFACIIFALYGVVCILITTYLAGMRFRIGLDFLNVASVALIFGGLSLTTAYGLWKLKKWGGMLGLGTLGLGILFDTFWGGPSIITILFSAILIPLIALSWKKLES